MSCESRVLTPSVGRVTDHLDRFPERHQLAVLLPERFRGGCSFGAGSLNTAGLSRKCRLAVPHLRPVDCEVNLHRSISTDLQLPRCEEVSLAGVRQVPIEAN